MALLLTDSTDAACASLVGEARGRALFIRSPEAAHLRAHPGSLQPLADAIEQEPDFAGHEALFLEVGPRTGALLAAVLHRTTRGQGAGGVRHWPYATLGALVKDGLRLSRGMGRKNALAGLWWGGGKGLIARQAGDRYQDPAYRAVLYEEYGRFVASLRGAYVAAEDVGTTPPDMASLFRTTRFTTCIPPAVGGSGNPSPSTARGVVCAMEAALEHARMGGLAGKRIAMQGAGNVGASMIGDLLARGVARIVATDVNPDPVRALVARFEGAPVTVRAVPPGDTSIFDEECDVLAPNALGGVLDPETIPRLRCAIVCGAANNQLEDDVRDGALLQARGVHFVPDFVANRMGIVTCANEQYGTLPDDPAIARHFDRTWENSIHAVTCRLLDHARKQNVTPTQAGNALADALGEEPHPIFPGRTAALLRSHVLHAWWEGRAAE